MSSIKAGSDGARILNAFRGNAWISLSEIHRRAGVSTSFNATIARLRKQGWKIEHRTVTGRSRPTLANQYRLLKPWPAEMPAALEEGVKVKRGLNRDDVPRNAENRFRIYVVDDRNKLLLMGTAPTEQELGSEICRLGRNDLIGDDCLGILDIFGDDPAGAVIVLLREAVLDNENWPGTWIVNPWGPRTI